MPFPILIGNIRWRFTNSDGNARIASGDTSSFGAPFDRVCEATCVSAVSNSLTKWPFCSCESAIRDTNLLIAEHCDKPFDAYNLHFVHALDTAGHFFPL